MLFYNAIKRRPYPQQGGSTLEEEVAWPMVLAGKEGNFLASAISGSKPLYLIPCGFVEVQVYVSPVPIKLNDLKNRTRATIVKKWAVLLQGIWHNDLYVFDVWRVTLEENTETAILCLHRASIVSKHYLLFQLMHTITKS